MSEATTAEGTPPEEVKPADITMGLEAWADTHFGNDMQRGMWLMVIGCLILEPFLLIAWSADWSAGGAIIDFTVNTITLSGKA